MESNNFLDTFKLGQYFEIPDGVREGQYYYNNEEGNTINPEIYPNKKLSKQKNGSFKNQAGATLIRKNYAKYKTATTDKDFQIILERELKLRTSKKITATRLACEINNILKEVEYLKEMHDMYRIDKRTKDHDLLDIADSFILWLKSKVDNQVKECIELKDSEEGPTAAAVALLFIYPYNSGESTEIIYSGNSQNIAKTYYHGKVSKWAGQNLVRKFDGLKTQDERNKVNKAQKYVTERITDIRWAISKMNSKFTSATAIAESEIIFLESYIKLNQNIADTSKVIKKKEKI